MNTELEKISFYFDEAVRQSKADPAFSIDRKFYELWENIQQPKPFLCDNHEITLGENTFKIVKETNFRKACFIWDKDEACVSLIVEGDEWLDKIQVFIDDGEPVFSQQEPEFLEEMGLNYGERLEVIFDIIAHLRENSRNIDIFNLKKNEYLSVLEELEGRYGKSAIAVMKKLSMASIKRLIRKASEDMPKDELSNQLHLPLDGTYVAHAEEDVDVAEQKDYIPSKRSDFSREHKISGCTRWEVIRNLELLRDSARFALEAEKAYVIPFNDAELVEKNDNYFTYKVYVQKNIPLAEGDILGVFLRGVDGEVGTFRVDIYDTDTIYGRIRFYDIPADEERGRERMFARPVRSPLNFLAAGMENFLQKFNENDISPLLRQITGVDESLFTETAGSADDSEMDDSQHRAWSCAIDDSNPVVLIQGPPGTGKTKVLTDVVKFLCHAGKRILVTAPSNTAVDNICRKVLDLPVLRFGRNPRSIAPDVASKCWIGEEVSVTRFVDQRKENRGGGIYAGTHVGLMKNDIIRDDVQKNGLYDVIVFDEAGMAAVPEFLMLAGMAERVVLFGDHKQLPPFPLPPDVLKRLDDECGPLLSDGHKILAASALEWLHDVRDFPVLLLKRSYRCQNPRLLRFSSILFYDALVTASEKAEYFSLPYHERIKKYPSDTLKLISTSDLPAGLHREELVFEGGKPGLENRCEAAICIHTVYQLLKKYPLSEITVIAPYKRQVRLMCETILREKAEAASGKKITEKQWKNFLYTRISTVDSFQGGESDVVIICYVRSNDGGGIGFVDDANRINVAHTRCRREMIIIGDIECLKKEAKNEIFKRLERSVTRDGEFVSFSSEAFKEISDFVFLNEQPKMPEIEKIEAPEAEKKKTTVEQALETPEKSPEEAAPPEIEQVPVITELTDEPPELIGMEQPDLF